MSSISIDIPTFQINGNDFQNLVSFIYKHEQILKDFGAIKIQPNVQCKLALKKRRLNVLSRPINEEIVNISSNEFIYNVKKMNDINIPIEEDLFERDEFSFWSGLSSLKNKRQPLKISLLPNKSFFSQRRGRVCFDIHRLPNQSLLKLGGRKLTRQFVPCLKRAHGSGAIFPLTSAQHHLFSINYHHEGGNHHWYIIPDSERNIIRKLIDKEDCSICLDHGQLLIDPSFLDKHHIRYHRIIQHPNEFLVFSAGSLTQCYTEDASWTESISFALPSWIEQGHANISNCQCPCDISPHSLSERIDLTLFRRELIQRYIISQLNINNSDKAFPFKDYNDIDINPILTPNSIETISSNAETPLSTYPKLITPHPSINEDFQSPSTSLITSSLHSFLFEEDKIKSDEKNTPIQYQLLEEGTVDELSDWNFHDRSSISTEDLSQENLIPNYNIDNSFLSFDELMDFFPTNSNDLLSTSKQINTSRKFSKSHVKKRNANHQTLFVSGLRSNIKKSDLRQHFIGSNKITIKQYRTTTHLKYAFISHRTSREAKQNLHRSMNFRLLGSQCRVEYANNSSNSNRNYQNFGKRKLMVARIPENVNEDHLHNLFNNCHILKYSPARSLTISDQTKKKKILWGYAFILCDNEEQADYMIKHSDRYHINGQTLVLSVYRNNK